MNIINKCLLGAVLLYIQPATTMADNNHGYFCGVNNETIRLKAGQIALSFHTRPRKTDRQEPAPSYHHTHHTHR